MNTIQQLELKKKLSLIDKDVSTNKQNIELGKRSSIRILFLILAIICEIGTLILRFDVLRIINAVFAEDLNTFVTWAILRIVFSIGQMIFLFFYIRLVIDKCKVGRCTVNIKKLELERARIEQQLTKIDKDPHSINIEIPDQKQIETRISILEKRLKIAQKSTKNLKKLNANFIVSFVLYVIAIVIALGINFVFLYNASYLYDLNADIELLEFLCELICIFAEGVTIPFIVRNAIRLKIGKVNASQLLFLEEQIVIHKEELEIILKSADEEQAGTEIKEQTI